MKILIVYESCFGNTQQIAQAVGACLDSQGDVGFLDRATPLSKTYEEHMAGSPFYRSARFTSSAEVGGRFARAAFDEVTCVQTIFASPGAVSRPSPVVAGHGRGLFVVIRGRRSS